MKKQNRLAQAASPYLQQHADNPVDWYEWEAEALQKAKNENKPLLISIGYSACHWCHVMEEESYRDDEVAQVMNQYFVSVKVDREERSDIDQIYIEAAQMLNGNAGWPLNVFALPDGRPFYIGTYFPKKQWISVLKQLHQVYAQDPQRVEKQAQALTEGVQTEFLLDGATRDEAAVEVEDLKQIVAGWKTKIDFENGGFTGQQKFPMPVSWDFLLSYATLTEDKEIKGAINTTLTAMARGGIYDQLGGGFSRYSVDEEWFAPHFEKMLYDNAQLVSLYAKAYQIEKKPLYKQVIEETLAFIQRELTSKAGGFYAALNADSEGEEGKFYVWTKAEIEAALTSEEAQYIIDYFNISPTGNWENGRNILYRTRGETDFFKAQRVSTQEGKKRLQQAKSKLMKLREKRIRPSTDDKILTSWNALMIKAYVEAYKSLGKEEYRKAALKNASFIHENLWREAEGLFRNYKDGKASIPAFLDDYAFLAEAYCALYEVSFDKMWLDRSMKLVTMAYTHFYDHKSGFFYYTSNQSDSLIARKFELIDNVLPSSNAVMAEVLYRLGTYFENEKYLETSQAMLQTLQGRIKQGSPYFGKWSHILSYAVFPPFEVAIMGSRARQKAQQIQQSGVSRVIFLGGEQENLPLLKDKLPEGKTMIYVCRNKTCQQPVEQVKEAVKQIQSAG